MKLAAQLWWKARKVKLSMWLFNRLYRDRDSGTHLIIENAVNQRATAAIMAWLSFKHIMHCDFCVQTESLKKSEKGYRCDKHLSGLDLAKV